jgi:hypothetical protein
MELKVGDIDRASLYDGDRILEIERNWVLRASYGY